MKKYVHISNCLFYDDYWFPVLNKKLISHSFTILGLLLNVNLLAQTSFQSLEIKMPYFFSDNMVIQRNKPIRFWGKGIASTSLQISFAGRKRTVFVSNRGDWDATFPSKKAGGPFTLQIKNKNKTTILKNIMIGDVWICSGQSNMEWPLYKSDSADQEIYSSDNDKIRHFFVPHQISSSLQNNAEASSWEICTKETAGLFTAVGYFFAKKIQQQTKIPIGIIHSTWGGTKARAWTSITGLQNLPEYQGLVDEFQIQSKSKKSIDAINQEYKQDTTEFKNVLSKKDKGYINRWYLPNINISNWKRITLPCLWEENALPNYDGIVWFKKQFNLSSGISESIFNLQLGVIDGMDDIWINGKLVSKDLWERSDRNILIKKGILKEGENNITICVLDTGGTGGFKAKAGEMKLKSMNPSKPLDISLEGEWYYEASTPLTKLPQVTC